MSELFKVTFLPRGNVCEAKAGESVLDVAHRNSIELDHACGGVCACSTCHVIVKKGFNGLEEASEEEEDMLDLAPMLSTTSRLACQIEINADLEVEIPVHNRNLVQEAEH